MKSVVLYSKKKLLVPNTKASLELFLSEKFIVCVVAILQLSKKIVLTVIVSDLLTFPCLSVWVAFIKYVDSFKSWNV